MNCQNCGHVCIVGNDGNYNHYICTGCNTIYEGYASSDSIYAAQIQYPEHLEDGYVTPYDYPDYPQEFQDETIVQQFQNEMQQFHDQGMYFDGNNNYDDPRERWENMTEHQRIHLFNTMMDNFHQQAVVDAAVQDGYISRQIARERRFELMRQSGEIAQAHLNQEAHVQYEGEPRFNNRFSNEHTAEIQSAIRQEIQDLQEQVDNVKSVTREIEEVQGILSKNEDECNSAIENQGEHKEVQAGDVAAQHRAVR